MEEFLELLRRRRALRIPPRHRMGVDGILRRRGISEEDFFELATEDDKWELIDGTLIIHTPVSWGHQEIAAFLFRLLSDYVEKKGLGVVTYNPMVARLAEGRALEPDIFFIHKGLRSKIRDLYVEAVPDMVIEVTAKRRRSYDLGQKLEVYQDAGVKEVWIIDWQKQQVYAYTRGPRGYSEKVVKEGRLPSKAVRGFWLDVGWLWKRPLPDKFKALEEILEK